MEVPTIRPITVGLIPLITDFTPAYLSKRVKTDAISRIIMKDGNTTPTVATRAPKIPAWDDPTKVAILTAMGPGVDSDTAIKFIISDSVNQPFDKQSSLIKDIIAYPPPNETTPIFKKVKNNSK